MLSPRLVFLLFGCAFFALFTSDLRWLRLGLIGPCLAALLYATSLIAESAKKRGNSTSANLFLLLISGLACFLLLEAVFMFVPRSHNKAVAHNLAHELWKDRYWGPINKFGFRDRPITDEDLTKKKILIVGDSFASGFGIKSINDRFGNVLEKELGNDYRILTVAEPGWDTRMEYHVTKAFPIEPDLLVLSYFGNDIRAPIVLNDEILFAPNSTERYLLTRSYLMNFLYFTLYRDPTGKDDLTGYLESSYGSPEHLSAHLSELEKFVDYAHTKKIPMVVVIFPHLRALEQSEIFVTPISAYFRSRNVPVLDVLPLARDLNPKQRVVNSTDNHPSVELHHRVGRALTPLVLATGIDQKQIAE